MKARLWSERTRNRLAFLASEVGNGSIRITIFGFSIVISGAVIMGIVRMATRQHAIP